MKSMNQMQEGETAIVLQLCCCGSIRRRMLDIGMIEGTQVECLMKSPSGNPVAYQIRGAVIAIRNEDAAQIIVKPGGVFYAPNT